MNKRYFNFNNFSHFLKSFIFQFFVFTFVKVFTKHKNINKNILINTYPSNKIEIPERLFQFSKNYVLWSVVENKVKRAKSLIESHRIRIPEGLSDRVPVPDLRMVEWYGSGSGSQNGWVIGFRIRIPEGLSDRVPDPDPRRVEW